MGSWRDIVAEQMQLLGYVGLGGTVAGCVLGREDDARWCREVAREHGIEFSAHLVAPDIRLYETPTLQLVWEWARTADPGSTVLYFHTKGASAPDDANKVAWRRLMQRHVIAGWRENVPKLHVADALGVDWQDCPDFPHFSGNFWIARADWLASLQSPVSHSALYPDLWIAGSPWRRIHAEMWLGSEPWHLVESLACRTRSCGRTKFCGMTPP
jgi:hypothetical protein